MVRMSNSGTNSGETLTGCYPWKLRLGTSVGVAHIMVAVVNSTSCIPVWGSRLFLETQVRYQCGVTLIGY